MKLLLVTHHKYPKEDISVYALNCELCLSKNKFLCVCDSSVVTLYSTALYITATKPVQKHNPPLQCFTLFLLLNITVNVEALG